MSIRWGIVGCGNVTEVKSGPALQKVGGFSLSMVMRRDAAAAQNYAKRHGVPRWTSDAAELIHHPEVDAVYIATPPGAHEELALQVAQAGKVCYVEKPMARHTGECQRMNDAFKAAGVPLFVAYYRRALPRFERVRQWLECGEIGMVTAVNLRLTQPGQHGDAGAKDWRLVVESSGGGLFLDLGSHALDLLDHLFGPLRQVRGLAANVGRKNQVEDVVAMVFRTESGAVGCGQWNFSGSVQEDVVEITGTEGRICFSVFDEQPVRLERQGGEMVEEWIEHPPHVQQPLIQSMADELAGGGRCPSTGQSAARTQAVMDEVLRGYYGSRGPGFWEDASAWPGLADSSD